LACCHTVNIDDEGEYSATSPDELALVSFAKKTGVYFQKRNLINNNITIEQNNEELELTVLNVIEFDSDRKMMSVFVKRWDTGQIIMLTKGADTVILPLTNTEIFPDNIKNIKKLPDHIVDDYLKYLDE